MDVVLQSYRNNLGFYTIPIFISILLTIGNGKLVYNGNDMLIFMTMIFLIPLTFNLYIFQSYRNEQDSYSNNDGFSYSQKQFIDSEIKRADNIITISWIALILYISVNSGFYIYTSK